MIFFSAPSFNKKLNDDFMYICNSIEQKRKEKKQKFRKVPVHAYLFQSILSLVFRGSPHEEKKSVLFFRGIFFSGSKNVSYMYICSYGVQY